MPPPLFEGKRIYSLEGIEEGPVNRLMRHELNVIVSNIGLSRFQWDIGATETDSRFLGIGSAEFGPRHDLRW